MFSSASLLKHSQSISHRIRDKVPYPYKTTCKIIVFMYEGVSRSFRTESITKYTLNFGITRCCPLQSVPLPSSCNGSSVSATAGSDFLESRVRRSVNVPEFQ
jgi:hypothetical protein